MPTRTVLFFSPELAERFGSQLTADGARATVEPPLHMVAPPDARLWARCVSELALFNWLLLPTVEAVEALLEAAGAPPASTLRVATIAPAGAALLDAGRAPEIEAQGLRALCDRLEGRLARRERILVPHAAAAGRVLPSWLTRLGADPVCVPAYALAVGERSRASAPGVAVVGNPAQAEALASLGSGFLGPGAATTTVALTAGAADAAEDCGLTAVELPLERLGAFLGEALS